MSKQSERKRKNFKCQNDISCILGHSKEKLTCTDCIAIILLFLCYAICSTLEIMHKFINNYDIIGQIVVWDKFGKLLGQNQKLLGQLSQ